MKKRAGDTEKEGSGGRQMEKEREREKSEIWSRNKERREGEEERYRTYSKIRMEHIGTFVTSVLLKINKSTSHQPCFCLLSKTLHFHVYRPGRAR